MLSKSYIIKLVRFYGLFNANSVHIFFYFFLPVIFTANLCFQNPNLKDKKTGQMLIKLIKTIYLIVIQYIKLNL